MRRRANIETIRAIRGGETLREKGRSMSKGPSQPLLALPLGRRAPEPIKLAFFDNATHNIEACEEGTRLWKYPAIVNGRTVPVQIECVDVGECNRIVVKSERRTALGLKDAFEFPNECHERLANYLTGDDGVCDYEPDGLVRELAGVYVDVGHGNFFDESSGLDPDVLALYADCDVWVLDWDRTITQAEGVLYVNNVDTAFNTPDDPHVTKRAWDDYKDTMLSAAITRYGASDCVFQLFEAGFATPEPVLKVLCGGSERYDRLKRALATKKSRGDPRDIYVLTYNPCRALISYMASALCPLIEDAQVISKHQYGECMGETLTSGDEDVYLCFQSKYEMIWKEIMPIVTERRSD